jgi:hypothetical protein
MRFALFEAVQWNKHGDHPAVVPATEDNTKGQYCLYKKDNCTHCGKPLALHGFIENGNDLVCPGNYVIHEKNGSYSSNKLNDLSYANAPFDDEQFEQVCEIVHNAWWDKKKKQGIIDHPDMIPYNELREDVKEYDRKTVWAVLKGLDKILRDNNTYNGGIFLQ